MRLIDAEKLFDEVGCIKPKNKQHYEDIGTFMKMITNSPTIEQKTGHWVEKKGRCGTYIECSECGCLAPSTEFADGVWFKKSNFCHECGAKMVEPQERSDKE